MNVGVILAFKNGQMHISPNCGAELQAKCNDQWPGANEEAGHEVRAFLPFITSRCCCVESLELREGHLKGSSAST